MKLVDQAPRKKLDLPQPRKLAKFHAQEDKRTLADKFVDKLSNSLLKVSLIQHTNLDKTMLGKPGHLAISTGSHSILLQPPTPMARSGTTQTARQVTPVGMLFPSRAHAWLTYHPQTHLHVPRTRVHSSTNSMWAKSLEQSKEELSESIANLQASLDQLSVSVENQSSINGIENGRNPHTPLDSQKLELLASIADLEASIVQLKGQNASLRTTEDQKEFNIVAPKQKSGAQGGAFGGGVVAGITAFVIGGPVVWAAGGGVVLGATMGYFAGAVSRDEDEAFNAGMAAGAGAGLVAGRRSLPKKFNQT